MNETIIELLMSKCPEDFELGIIIAKRIGLSPDEVNEFYAVARYTDVLSIGIRHTNTKEYEAECKLSASSTNPRRKAKYPHLHSYETTYIFFDKWKDDE